MRTVKWCRFCRINCMCRFTCTSLNFQQQITSPFFGTGRISTTLRIRIIYGLWEIVFSNFDCCSERLVEWNPTFKQQSNNDEAEKTIKQVKLFGGQKEHQWQRTWIPHTASEHNNQMRNHCRTPQVNGGSRISQGWGGGCSPWGGSINLLFCKIFAKKLHEN